MNENKTIQDVKNILTSIIQKELNNVPEVAIPFSGSLDSSLVAFIVKNYTNCKIKLYTIGFPGCYDFKQSTTSATHLSLKRRLTHIQLQQSKIAKDLKEYMLLTGDKDKVSISYSLPFFILVKNIPEEYIITGHGADTLFGGFYKYLGVKGVKIKIKSCYKEFLLMLKKREYKMAKYFSKNLILPFANDELAEFVLDIPDDLFIRNGIRKYILRKVAEALGLHQSIVKAPKKALQYSSGMMKELRKTNCFS
ncbi:hypothetical protein JW766_03470 [Candidatus Dojkabacteria bacterium]|nr:hypothetical protein [Candidatus Dojkabacteria bacterium]